MKLGRILAGVAVVGTAAFVAVKRGVIDASVAFNSLDPAHALDDGSEFIDIQGLRVRTRVAGAGRPAIVLLHGFAASVFTWCKVFEPLSQIGTVIAFDRPACGFTSRPVRADWNGDSPYSLMSQAELTIAMLDHFGIDRAILVGHSAGGTVAMLTALNHPDRVESLVLVAPAVYTDVPPPPWLSPIFDTTAMAHVGPRIARAGARIANPIMNRAWHDPRRISPDIRAGYLRPFESRNWDIGMWEAARANRPAQLGDQVGSLTIPTLVMSGDDDHVISIADTKRLAAELPNATLKVISACGHIPQEEQPQAFLDTVVPFIKADLSAVT